MPIQRVLRLAVAASALSADIRQAPRLARGAGFSGLQVSAYAPGVSLPDLSASGLREFRRLFSSQDQQLASIAVDLGARGLGPGADVDRLIDRLERAMQAAAELGTPLLCVEMGPLPAPAEKPRPRPALPPNGGMLILPTAEEVAALTAAPAAAEAPFDAGLAAQVDGALAELGQRADRYNCTLALRSDLSSFAALHRALRAANCPWLGVDLDPVAILRDPWGADEVFSRLGGLIRHVRARDAIAGADRRTRPAPIAHGSTSWQALFAALDDAGYGGWITLDPTDLPNRTASALDGLAHLKDLA